MTLKAPFPWFGGKRRAAPMVWDALGDVANYAEPFAGSLACLLARPETHTCNTETVNDKDHFISNFWRAVQADPEQVAHYADWPVNEGDLFARHLWLVNEGRARIQAQDNDPDYCDAKVAGWWVWGLCSWIGSGWCEGGGPHGYAGNAGQGVNRQLPHLGDAGKGVNRKLPHLGDAGKGVRFDYILGEMSALAARLRSVRVACGDWERVLSDSVLKTGATKGIFLDPPYLGEVSEQKLYREECGEIANLVREWAIKNGDRPDYRIVLAGYDTDHAGKMPGGWTEIDGKAGGGGGYSNGKNGNHRRERLWLSPNCLSQASLFRASA